LTKAVIFRAAVVGASIPVDPGLKFAIVDGFSSALAFFPTALKNFGLGAALRLAAKVSTVDRAYYCLLMKDTVLSDGWIMFGRCKAYPIGHEDHVIGPINTRLEHRGRGYAKMALANALAYCLRQGARFVYIDTVDTNVASRNTITAAGFTEVDPSSTRV
jgi:hypothetical protein